MTCNLIAMAEAARVLGVSVFTVRRLAESGEVKSVYVGARRLIPMSEVERIATVGAGRPRFRRRQDAKSGGRSR